MMNRKRRMHQQATYWRPGKPDGFGKRSFGPPEHLMVRWESVGTLYRDAEGQQVTSQHTVFCPIPVELEGYLAQGHMTDLDPTTAKGADEIRNVQIIPNLRGNTAVVRALL